mgnify:CR=1 FL=1
MIILTLEADVDSYYKINTFLLIEIAIMNIFFHLAGLESGLALCCGTIKKTIEDKNNKVRLYSIYKLRKYSSSLLLSFLY